MKWSSAARMCAVPVFALGCWMAYVRTQFPPPQRLTLNRLKDNLYEIEGDGGNVAVYVTSEGVILVDDKHERDYDAIMTKIRTVTSLPVKYVFNTHYHVDHCGSNDRFLPSAQIVSTAVTRDNIVRDPFNRPPGVLRRAFELSKYLLVPPRPGRNRQRLVPASVVFTKESHVFLGGKEVRAYYFGRGHTGGDAIVYFPQQRTISTGDLMTNRGPLINYNDGGSLAEWTKTLDEVLKLDFDTVIPGHGAATDKAGLIAYRNNIARLRDRVASLACSGKTQAEIEKVTTTEFGWAPSEMVDSPHSMMKEVNCDAYAPEGSR